MENEVLYTDRTATTISSIRTLSSDSAVFDLHLEGRRADEERLWSHE